MGRESRAHDGGGCLASSADIQARKGALPRTPVLQGLAQVQARALFNAGGGAQVQASRRPAVHNWVPVSVGAETGDRIRARSGDGGRARRGRSLSSQASTQRDVAAGTVLVAGEHSATTSAGLHSRSDQSQAARDDKQTNTTRN